MAGVSAFFHRRARATLTGVRLLVGLAIWVGIVVVAWDHMERYPLTGHEPIGQINTWLFDDHTQVRLTMAVPSWIKPHRGHAVIGPVLLDEETGVTEMQPVGEIWSARKLDDGRWEMIITVFPHASDIVTRGTVFRGMRAPDGFEEVVHTLVDDDAKAYFREQWGRFMMSSQERMKRMFVPLLEDAMRDFVALVTPAIEQEVRARQHEFNAIFRSHYDESIRARLLPAIERHGMPMVESRIMPIVRECGQALWENAPAGSFVWNAFRDKIVPWDSTTNLQERFESWLAEDGRPIIDQYVPRLKAAAEGIGEDLAGNPEITGIVEDAIGQIIRDDRLNQLAERILRRAVLENPATTEFLRSRWNDPRLQNALRSAGNMVEPYVTRMVDSVLLDRSGQAINPKLVQVLRSEILWKSDFWILAEPPVVDDPGARAPLPDGWHVPPGQVRFGRD